MFDSGGTRRSQVGTEDDPHDVLGVPRDATAAQIKKAYYRLAKVHHPDRLPKDATEEERKEATAKFAVIGEAYERLTNPQKNGGDAAGSAAGGAGGPFGDGTSAATASGGYSSFFSAPMGGGLFGSMFGGLSTPFASFGGGGGLFGAPPPAATASFHQHGGGFTDPFVLFEQTFGRSSLFDDLNDDFFFGPSMSRGGGGVSTSAAGSFPFPPFGGLGSGAGGFAMMSSTSTRTEHDPATGGMKTISQVTELKDGKRSTRTETTLVHPDGRREVTVEIDDDGDDHNGRVPALPASTTLPARPAIRNEVRNDQKDVSMGDGRVSRDENIEESPTRKRTNNDMSRSRPTHIYPEMGSYQEEKGNVSQTQAFEGSVLGNVHLGKKRDAEDMDQAEPSSKKRRTDIVGNNANGHTDISNFQEQDGGLCNPPARGTSPQMNVGHEVPNQKAAMAASNADELGKLTVVDLKQRLRERGLKVSGRKAELIERLIAYQGTPSTR